MVVHEALLIFKKEYNSIDSVSIKIIDGRHCSVDTIDNFLESDIYQSLREKEIECFDTERLYIECIDAPMKYEEDI